MKNSLPFRQIHLDFHTSEYIEDVGKDFDGEDFAKTLKEAHVNSVTCFARCHHGWSYYPSKIVPQHPHLKKDILSEMVSACKKYEIDTPIYITSQWDELTARIHPEWRVMYATGTAPTSANIASSQDDSGWHTLCLSNQEYIDYIIAQTLEVIDMYHPPGIFFDIHILWECVCPNCVKRMQESNLNPDCKEDRLANHRQIILEYCEKLTKAIREVDKDIRIFFNSGHIDKGDRIRWENFTHFELESLPTGGWGYDHFPVSARYTAIMGKEYLGMTGKFYTTWGEFGGFKKSVALEYETALMVALGARCSIGDQLHPNGFIDKETYKTIAPAYGKVEKIEPYLTNATPYSKIAILSAEGIKHKRDVYESSDIGAARMLLELHQMFDIIDLDSNFNDYKLIIMPDAITFDAELTKRTQDYLAKGGKLILSGTSGMNENCTDFAIPFGAKVSGDSEFSPDYILTNRSLDSELIDSPFIIYERAKKVKATTAEVLAESRLPYLNRSWLHFNSHQHYPYKPEANKDYDAVMLDGNVAYFSHPIFLAYYNLGQPLFKYLMRGVMKKLLGSLDVEIKNFSSSGRVSLMEQAEDNRLIIHLLHAKPQLRGEAALGWNSSDNSQKMEIIEDELPIFNLECSIAVAKDVKNVKNSDGEELQFSYNNGILSFKVDELYIHKLIVVEYV